MANLQMWPKLQRLCDNALQEVNATKSFFRRMVWPASLPYELTIAVGGWGKTGKTTLAYYLRDGSFHKDVARTTGREDFEGKVGTRTAKLSTYQGEWEGLFREVLADIRPHGIVFMVDHENRSSHEDGWALFCRFISRQGIFARKSRRARSRLSTVLLLINKHDEWRPRTRRDGSENPYRKEVEEMTASLSQQREVFKVFDVVFLRQECSLLLDDNVGGSITRLLKCIARPTSERKQMASSNTPD